ncbi:MAG TPA: hypothetical protein VGM90_34800 [Kofleriaceae bacterium]|jgi:hypothetical protein
MNRALLVIAVAGCGGAQPVTSPERPIVVSARSTPSEQVPPGRCVTMRDQELACQNACEPVKPRLDACVRHVAHTCRDSSRTTRITAKFTVRAAGGIANLRIDVSPAGDEWTDFTACLESALARFVPCLPSAQDAEMTLPFILTGC